jgi:hypothetical protein
MWIYISSFFSLKNMQESWKQSRTRESFGGQQWMREVRNQAIISRERRGPFIGLPHEI